MRSKKGLDTVVTTLIIVLLAIVAVGIVWVVVRNVVQQGANQVNVNAECLSVDLSAVNVAPNGTAGDYTVTLKRNGGTGSDVMGGISLTVFNSSTNSNPIDFGTPLTPGQTATKTIVSTNVTNATSIQYTAYFTDSSGNKQLCSQTGTFNF